MIAQFHCAQSLSHWLTALYPLISPLAWCLQSSVKEMIKDIYTTLTKGSLPVSTEIQFNRVPKNPGLLAFFETGVKII